MKHITIIDYDAGNIKSVSNALSYLGCETSLASSPDEILRSDRVILPGVGSFGAASDNLFSSGLENAVREYVHSGRPFLGICLGLQLLFAESEESPGKKGLSIFEGEIKRFPKDMGLKVPHIGWNSLDIKNRSGIFKGIPDGSFVYFVHSYYLRLKDRSDCAAECTYGIPFDAAVQRGNASAVQFHPEKSGETGLNILRNFISL